MFALTEISQVTQRAVCMLMAAVIVAVSIGAGVIAVQSAEHTGYSITIAQLQ